VDRKHRRQSRVAASRFKHETARAGTLGQGSPKAVQKTNSFTHKLLLTLGLIAFLAIVAVFFWRAMQVILLVFLGLLLAATLSIWCDWLQKQFKWPRYFSLMLLALALASLATATWSFLAPEINDQIEKLSYAIPEGYQKLRENLSYVPWTERIIRQVPTMTDLATDPEILRRTVGIFSNVIGTLTGLIIVIFVAMYVAAEPDMYQRGFVALFPQGRRERIRNLLSTSALVLRRWLGGQLVAMLIIGSLTTLGLWLLDIPLAFSLGVLAALLNFIPNIGPVISFVPAALVAMMKGSEYFMYVFILYLIIQTLESNFVTPLIQRKMVLLPPALTIVSQILLGVMLGGLGLVLAAPITAVALVWVNQLYIQDYLGDKGQLEWK
jgi:predicted PurR-regulated permease PerM